MKPCPRCEKIQAKVMSNLDREFVFADTVIDHDSFREAIIEQFEPEVGADKLTALVLTMVQKMLGSVRYDEEFWKYLIDAAIEALRDDGGICTYDHHRSLAQINEDGGCDWCDSLKEEHEMVLVCPRNVEFDEDEDEDEDDEVEN